MINVGGELPDLRRGLAYAGAPGGDRHDLDHLDARCLKLVAKNSVLPAPGDDRFKLPSVQSEGQTGDFSFQAAGHQRIHV